jgi:hypothetical protein
MLLGGRVERALVLERAIRRGSSWPIVVTTEGGRFLTKLRGAGQGTPALVAEWMSRASRSSWGSASRAVR